MLIDAAKSSLLIIDVQERLLPAMAAPDQVIKGIGILLKAVVQLEVPVSVSEQYPRGLGSTVEGIKSNSANVFEKLAFSVWRDPALKQHFTALHEGGRPQVIVAGIEAHVCVLQSCIDFAKAGFAVFAVRDAMSSRQADNVTAAADRMRQNGVQVVTTEMVVFELLQKAGTPAFKALSALIR